MKERYFKRVKELTPTRFWINNVTEKEADLAIAEGAVGCTQNPSYVNKMLTHTDGANDALTLLDEILARQSDAHLVQEELQRTLVGKIAEHFRPLYDESHGRMGYVSIQGNPFKGDVESIVNNALYNREAGPNIMAKIPVTKEGLEAIGILMAKGVPINATEVMSVRQVLDVCDVYDKVASTMDNPPMVYFSHIGGIFDEYMKNYVTEKKLDVNSDALFQAGTICAKKVYRLVEARKSDVGFISGGARGLHHFTELVGGKISVTINWKGTADSLLEKDYPVIDRFNSPTSEGFLDELLEKVDEFRRAWYINGITPEEYDDYGPVVLFKSSFEKNWLAANACIEKRRAGK